MQPEHVGPISLRVDRDRDLGPYAEAACHLFGQRMLRTRTKSNGAAARPYGPKHLGDARVHGLVPEREGTWVLRPGVLHGHAPRPGLRIARIDQPRPIAIEDRKHFVEDVAHHLLEVVRALDRPVDPIQAFEEPEMGAAFLFRALALGDVDHDAAQAACAAFLQHDGHQVSHPDDVSVCRNHAVLEVMVAFVGDGCFPEPDRRFPIVWMEMVGPERRFGKPALHRVAEDALCLFAHEGEPEARHIRFPDDSLDRIHQIAEAPLRAYGLGEGLALGRQQTLSLVLEPLPFADVFDGPDEPGGTSRFVP